MLQERFQHVTTTRQECVKRVNDALWEKEELLRTDLEKEAKARDESIKALRECIDTDFPELETTIQNEVNDREQADQKIE